MYTNLLEVALAILRLHLPVMGQKFVIGDFNLHNTMWGYNHTNKDGTLVEQWAETNSLQLIHNAKLLKSILSGNSKRGYNPDIGFIRQNFTHAHQACV